MPAAHIRHLRLYGAAYADRDWTARVKAAAFRRVGRARDFAAQRRGVASGFARGIWRRRRGDQRTRVGMGWRIVDFAGGADLDDLAEIHHRDTVGEAEDAGKVVRNKQIG